MENARGIDNILRRQESNWVQEITASQTLTDDANIQRDDEEEEDEEGEIAGEVESLRELLASMESQMASVEELMDPRARAGDHEVPGLFGRQIDASLRATLSHLQESNASVAARIKVLSETARPPQDITSRHTELASRLERIDMAQRARCPPQELERRLSRRESSLAEPAAANISSSSTVGGQRLTRAQTIEDVLVVANEGEGDDEDEERQTKTTGENEDMGGVDVEAAPDRREGRIEFERDETHVRRCLSESSRDAKGDNGGDAGERPPSRSSMTRITPMDLVRMRSNRVLTTLVESQDGIHNAGDVASSEAGTGVSSGVADRESSAAEGVSVLERPSRKGDASAAAKEEMPLGDGMVLEPETDEANDMGIEEQEAKAPQGGEAESMKADDVDDAEPDVVPPGAAVPVSMVRVFSFGRGDQGALLQQDNEDHSAGEGAVALKDHWSLLQVATSSYHTTAVTASGDVIGCGLNEEGQVRPDLRGEAVLARPSLVEPLLSHRVTQVSCGLYHTACVTADGVAITWGGNESGQLGHSPQTTRAAQPMAVQVTGTGRSWSSTRRAARVACGERFTLILTSRAEVLSCGIGDCVGGDGTDRRQASIVQSLAGFPAVWMACGNKHSVVIGAGGEVVAFGINNHGQLGVGASSDGEGTVLLPRQVLGTTPQHVAGVISDMRPSSSSSSMGSAGGGDRGSHGSRVARRGNRGSGGPVVTIRPSFLAARAACGESHTVFVSTSGEVWACGRNRTGQLGLDPDAVPEIFVPVRVPLTGAVSDSPGSGADSGVDVVQVAAGRAHTLLLMSDGRVVGFGSDEFGALGVSLPTKDDVPMGAEESEMDPGVGSTRTTSWHWQPRVIEALVGQRIASVSAGGEQSFAIAISPPLPQRGLPGTGGRVSAPGGEAKLVAVAGDEGAALSATGAGVVSGGSREGNESEVLVPAGAATVAARGVVYDSTRKIIGGEDLLRQGSEAMFRRRKFSIPAVTPMRTARDFLKMLHAVQSASGMEGGGGHSSTALETLIEAIRQTFGSPSVLSGSFEIAPTGSGQGGVELTQLDAEGLEKVYAGIMALGARAQRPLAAAVEQGLASVAAAVGAESGNSAQDEKTEFLSLRTGVSCLLKYWQSPTLGVIQLDEDGKGRREAFSRLCRAILELHASARWRLMRSAKEDYPAELFARRLVKPMLDGLERYLRVDHGRGAGVPSVALILKWLHSINELESTSKVPYETFFSNAVSSLPLEVLLIDLYKWQAATPEGRKTHFFFSEHAFLISTETKKTLLQLDRETLQRRAAAQSAIQLVPGLIINANPYLIIKVNRSNLLRETITQVQGISDVNLLKKLKVIFIGEEGVDEGGVAKEFFQLLTVQLFDRSFGMFVPAGEEGRWLWFNKDCVWADDEYALVGLLVGLAVYAGVILDVPLPLVVFRKVLGHRLSLKDLDDIDPDLLRGLQKLNEYEGDDVEDVFGIDFTVTWDDLGMERKHELKPGGSDIPVTSGNKEEYVELYARFLLMESVSRQFEKFKEGFMRVMGGAASIGLLRPEELDVLATGTLELDFDEFAKATKYDGGYHSDHPTIRAFWETVQAMPLQQQKQLLMFATGSMKAPLGGLGKLAFMIQRAGPDSDQLPTSHTCFNVLVLPEYSSPAKLQRLLTTAITECEGFGLR